MCVSSSGQGKLHGLFFSGRVFPNVLHHTEMKILVEGNIRGNVVILTMCVWHCKMPSPEMLPIMKLVRPGMNNIQVYSLLTEGLGLPYDSGQFVGQWVYFYMNAVTVSFVNKGGYSLCSMFRTNGVITGISSWSWCGIEFLFFVFQRILTENHSKIRI